jgi:hypothetical protein
MSLVKLDIRMRVFVEDGVGTAGRSGADELPVVDY